MARGGKDSISLCMLYNSVNDMSKALSGSLAEVLNAVRESSEEGKQRTAGQIASEVGKMRNDLSMTHNRVSTIDTQTGNTEAQVAHLHERMTALSSAVADIAENVGRLQPDAVPVPLPGQRSVDEGEDEDEARGGDEAAGAGDHGDGGDGEDGDDSVDGDSGGHGPEPTEHGALMLHAAGISSAHLICHRDSWQFLMDSVSGHKHFCPPWEVCDHGKGRVKAVLSGRSLIAVLISLRQVQNDCVKDLDGSWALATTLYRRIQDSLYRANAAGSEPLTIILDDGVIDEEDET